MRRIYVILLGLAAFVLLAGLSPALAQYYSPDKACCERCPTSTFSIGQVIQYDSVHTIANVLVDNWRIITLDFRRSQVGVCSGVQSRDDVSQLPSLGDAVAIAREISASCQECLATC
jgi:hypothetical protein